MAFTPPRYMSVARDIVATYRRPGRVMSRLLERDENEPRVLMYLMLACGLMFIAQMPRLARQAHLTGEDQNMLMGGALMGWVFIAPLFFYTLAWGVAGLMRVFGRKIGGFSARVALFWALLAAAPLFLLQGLVGGFIGQGIEMTLTGLLWLGAFLWFWLSGLRQASGQKQVSAV